MSAILPSTILLNYFLLSAVLLGVIIANIVAPSLERFSSFLPATYELKTANFICFVQRSFLFEINVIQKNNLNPLLEKKHSLHFIAFVKSQYLHLLFFYCQI